MTKTIFPNGVLYFGDSFKKLLEIESNCIDTIIFSPPYAGKRKYPGAKVAEYSDWFMPIANELLRVLKQTGSFFLNIKEHAENGQRSLYVYRLLMSLTENGWRFVDEFIWVKTNPFPTGNLRRLKDGYERIYHLAKTKNYLFYPNQVLIPSTDKNKNSAKKRINLPHATKNGSPFKMQERRYREMVRPSNVITTASSSLHLSHPATYPISIPDFFIRLTTQPGNLILDPFIGSGTTALAALMRDRSFIGIEIERKYYNLARQRIAQSSIPATSD